jgi:hypothetical protein
LVDGLEEVGGDFFGEERLKELEVVGGFGGRETTEKIEGGVERHWCQQKCFDGVQGGGGGGGGGGDRNYGNSGVPGCKIVWV